MAAALATAAIYLLVAAFCATALARRRVGDEERPYPAWLAALWPLLAPLLAAYYAAALAYTLAVVLRGRRAGVNRRS